MSCRPRRLSASGTWSRSAGRSLRRVRRSSCSRKATSGRSRPACAPATTPLPLSLPDLLRARLLSPVERGNLVATVESMAADARTQAYERALSLAHEIQQASCPSGCRHHLRQGSFVTVFFGLLDPESGACTTSTPTTTRLC